MPYFDWLYEEIDKIIALGKPIKDINILDSNGLSPSAESARKALNTEFKSPSVSIPDTKPVIVQPKIEIPVEPVQSVEIPTHQKEGSPEAVTPEIVTSSPTVDSPQQPKAGKHIEVGVSDSVVSKDK